MNTHIHHSFLGLVEDLLENRDPEAVQDRLEELKGIVAPLSPARRNRYVRLLQEVSKSSALDKLENQAISPVSQAAFQSLEELEAQAARLPFLFLDEEPPKEPTGGEELVTISARIGSADAPETIREATDILLNACRAQDGLFDQMLYCSWGRKLMEEKILTEEQGRHPIPALSLWDSLRRAPCEALAISLLWYDRKDGLFHSAAPEVLASLDTPEKLWKAIEFYETALLAASLQERILCQRELCRCILRQAAVWLSERGLDKEPPFHLFAKAIRQYLWGELSFLNLGDENRDTLVPSLVLRLSEALAEQEIPVPPVLSRLLKLCIAAAMDYRDPSLTCVLEEGEGQ